MIELFPSSEEEAAGRARRGRAGGALRHAARRALRADAARARPRLRRGGARRRSSTGRGVPERGRDARARRGRLRRGRLHAGRAGLRAGGRTRRRAAGRPRQQQDDEELRAAAEAGATVVLDALGEAERARRRPACARVLVRVAPGVEAETHGSIRTGHHGSKFGTFRPTTCSPRSPRRSRPGSGRRPPRARRLAGGGRRQPRWQPPYLPSWRLAAATPWAGRPRSRLRRRLWRAARARRTGVRRPPGSRVASPSGPQAAWGGRELPEPRLAFEPRPLASWAGRRDALPRRRRQAGGRGPAVGGVDGGMSDNPRPQLYGARYEGAAREPRRRAAVRARSRSRASTASRATC